MSAFEHKIPLDIEDPVSLNSWREFFCAEFEWTNRMRQAEIEGWGGDITKYTDEDRQLFKRITMWIDAHKPKPVDAVQYLVDNYGVKPIRK